VQPAEIAQLRGWWVPLRKSRTRQLPCIACACLRRSLQPLCRRGRANARLQDFRKHSAEVAIMKLANSRALPRMRMTLRTTVSVDCRWRCATERHRLATDRYQYRALGANLRKIGPPRGGGILGRPWLWTLQVDPYGSNAGYPLQRVKALSCTHG